jgi:hypothetical protein
MQECDLFIWGQLLKIVTLNKPRPEELLALVHEAVEEVVEGKSSTEMWELLQEDPYLSEPSSIPASMLQGIQARYLDAPPEAFARENLKLKLIREVGQYVHAMTNSLRADLLRGPCMLRFRISDHHIQLVDICQTLPHSPPGCYLS